MCIRSWAGTVRIGTRAMSSHMKHVVERKPILTPEEKREFEGYEFPFENLAFQGGGSKGLAYVGTFRVLEEVGIAKNLRRFSGTSIGAMMAMFAALGLDSFEMEEQTSFDFKTLVNDGRFGYVGAGINLYRKMGACPAHKLVKFFRERIESKFGNPDLTFKQLYRESGRELCLTAVSLNRLQAEYLHVKTTPDLPIWLGLRGAVTVPALMMPIKYKVMSKEDDIFVDGGVIHNYPVACFDGWYLSMDKADSFLRRFRDVLSLRDQFAGFNEKSIGAVVYSEDESESFKVALEERACKNKKTGDAVPIPDTKRSRKKAQSNDEKMKLHVSSKQALTKLVELLGSYDKDESGTISKQEFKDSLEDATDMAFSDDDAKLLFGSDSKNPDAIFDLLDINGNGEIEFDELLAFAEKRGVDLMEELRGFERLADFDHVMGLLSALLSTLVINANRMSIKADDIDRTIGINTGYIGSTDFPMESEDRDYIIQNGKVGTVYFLREYIKKHNLQKKAETNSGDAAESNDVTDVATPSE
ncbi:uncharacterized protein LOC119731462 [Patiria miniata]|uniref:Uncharacterized protein n=1 Tax=Patiria miniata TaxID=46514 RepID=A0A914A9W5_PATMI|nr:uncharacterized protein LOC119731462 [Patiria miniata]